MSFLASCLAVEEMAKVDASVAVCLDVQNTLVNNVSVECCSSSHLSLTCFYSHTALQSGLTTISKSVPGLALQRTR